MKEYFISYQTLSFSIGEMTEDELRYLKEKKFPLLNPDIVIRALQDIPLNTVEERVEHHESLQRFVALCYNRQLFYASNQSTDKLPDLLQENFSTVDIFLIISEAAKLVIESRLLNGNPVESASDTQADTQGNVQGGVNACRRLCRLPNDELRPQRGRLHSYGHRENVV